MEIDPAQADAHVLALKKLRETRKELQGVLAKECSTVGGYQQDKYEYLPKQSVMTLPYSVLTPRVTFWVA